MRTSWTGAGAIAMTLLLAASMAPLPVLLAEHEPEPDRFWLDLDGPDRLLGGEEGSMVTAMYLCTLAHRGDGPGAQGWTIVITAENVTPLSISTAGTDAERFLGEVAFERSLLTSWGEVQAAVSTVVLSLVEQVTLPPRSIHSIARLEVETAIPRGEGTAVLAYSDSPPGVDGPFLNLITQQGDTFTPFKGRAVVGLVEAPDCCRARLSLGFSRGRIRSPMPFRGIVDESDGCRGSDGEIVTRMRDGDGIVVVHANAISRLEDARAGVEGWTIVVGLEGDAEMDFATTDGTAGAPAPEGYRRAVSFEKTEIIPPGERFGGVRGAVSGVVLGLNTPVSLPARGTESIIKLGVAPASAEGDGEGDGEGDADRIATLRFLDDLGGSGQPVDTLFTVAGATERACNTDFSGVTLVFTGGAVFTRGDANDDGDHDVADPVFSLGFLFLGGPPPPCADAADANDDSAIDLSDATYSIAHLFLGGPRPPAPYPHCGRDPTDEDGLDCVSARECETRPRR